MNAQHPQPLLKSPAGQACPYARGDTVCPSSHFEYIIQLDIAEVDAESGEQWLVTEIGIDPRRFVVCYQDMITRYFKGEKRTIHVRRPDGTLHQCKVRHKKPARHRRFPVLYLETLEL